MEELNKTPETPVDNESTSKTEDTVEETVEQDDESDDQTESEDEDGGEVAEKDSKDGKERAPWGLKNHTPKGVREKFSKLTEKIRAMEARNQQLEESVKRANSFVDKQTQTRTPTKQDFLNAGRTEEDYITYLVQQQTSQQVAALEHKRQQAELMNRDAQEINSKWEANFAKAKEVLHDYDEVVGDSQVQLPVATIRYLATVENGPYISYAIGKNPSLQAQIQALPVGERHNAVLEVEKQVKVWLSQSNAKPVVQQPVPPQSTQPKKTSPLRSPTTLKSVHSSKNLDPSKASIEEWLGI